MHPHQFDALVEVGSKGSEKVEAGLKVTRAIAASEAFRKYNWLKNAPIRNVSGNFRGMIVSKRWATIFHFAEDTLKPVEKVALIAALAENIVKAEHQFGAIMKSRDSSAQKAARMSTQISSIALRTAGGAIPAGAHILALSLGGYCQVAGLLGSQRAFDLDRRLKSLDTKVTSLFDTVTDGEKINIFINTHLVIR